MTTSFEAIRTPVQKLADALATLENARAHLHRSKYLGPVVARGWGQWFASTCDAVNILNNAVSQTKQIIANEIGATWTR